jgi:formylglycine-generating enzyme required for sulfatase activity
MALFRASIGIAIVFLCGPAGAISENRFAFVIGNPAYENAGVLANPVRDAKAVAALREAGFAEVIEADNLSKHKFDDGDAASGTPKLPLTPVVDSGNGCADGLLVSLAKGKNPCIKPGSGQFFKDCPDCPEMVVVPAGNFRMGSTQAEVDALVREYGKDIEQYFTRELPQHEVTIGATFAVGRFAVTFAEWDACVADGGCGGYKPDDSGWGRDDRPVINVSWSYAKTYVAWLSQKTGKEYRLLSEAEWEYAARAGTTTPFWWGQSISTEMANYNGNYTYGGSAKGEYRQKTVPVKSFKPNPWGLYQVHGNVYDWVEDCWHDSYQNAPGDGLANTTGECKYRVLRGGTWYNYPRSLRAAHRLAYIPDLRLSHLGLRVARTIVP